MDDRHSTLVVGLNIQRSCPPPPPPPVEALIYPSTCVQPRKFSKTRLLTRGIVGIVKVHHVGGLRRIRLDRTAALDKAEVNQRIGVFVSIVTDSRRNLGRYSRAGRFRGPSSDSIFEEWARVDQPDPSRSLRGVLGNFDNTTPVWFPPTTFIP